MVVAKVVRAFQWQLRCSLNEKIVFLSPRRFVVFHPLLHFSCCNKKTVFVFSDSLVDHDFQATQVATGINVDVSRMMLSNKMVAKWGGKTYKPIYISDTDNY